MVMLFRRFRRTEVINNAANIWAEGDKGIEELCALGERLHGAIQSGKASEAETAAMAHRVEELDVKLTALERDFSAPLSAGARQIDETMLVGLPLAACVLLALGLIVTAIVTREIAANEAERKRAETAMEESVRRYRELLENANDIVYVHDLEGNFLSWNRKGEELLGYKIAETKRLHVRDVVAPCPGGSSDGGKAVQKRFSAV